MRAVALVLLAACHPVAPRPAPQASADTVRVRLATWNVSMYRDAAGRLASDLLAGDAQAQLAAGVLQEVRPDILLLNEFDHDEAGRPIDVFADRYLNAGPAALRLEHRRSPEVNTGAPSGLDLDGDGAVGRPPGSRAAAADCWGYGVYPGQYGVAVLSRFPFGGERSFRTLPWAAMPGNQLEGEGGPLFPPEVAREVRLSSKTHVDLEVEVGAGLHLLVSHPTPPVFDGPEDRNGRRNHDELRLWSDYVSGEGWMTDDAGRQGGLGGGPFVVLGDLNNDPFDGDGRHDAILGLIAAAGRRPEDGPRSGGAVEGALMRPETNAAHLGDPAMDTIVIDRVGNLRLDYVLPSTDLRIVDQGVYWPPSNDPRSAVLGTGPFPVSDHRLVWVDVEVPCGGRCPP